MSELLTKVMLATPCRDVLDVRYVNGLVSAVSGKMDGYWFVPTLSMATYVQTARNVMADEALNKGCHKIVFIDADIGWTLADLYRLLSHDVDIVGADYCKRVQGDEQPTARAEPGSKPNENGLQQCTSLPGGFLAIKTDVFRKMYELYPERRYRHEGKFASCEYFPLALTEKGGPGFRHPAEVKLDRIRDAITAGKDVDMIGRILEEEPSELPEIVGEDVGFCRLARGIGLDCWCDVTLKIRHYGNIGFPARETPL